MFVLIKKYKHMCNIFKKWTITIKQGKSMFYKKGNAFFDSHI